MNTQSTYSRFTTRETGTIALQLLCNTQLGDWVRSTSKLSVERFRKFIDETIISTDITATSYELDLFDVHQRLVKGLPGAAILIASALAFDTFQEGEVFFSVSSWTARQRIGKRLKPDEGEKALRLVHVLLLATRYFGAEAARAYLRTPNYALGGMTPKDLLRTFEGERLVMNELATHFDSGAV